MGQAHPEAHPLPALLQCEVGSAEVTEWRVGGHTITAAVTIGKLIAIAICSCGRTFRYDPDSHDPTLAWEMKMVRHIRGDE